MKLAEIINAIRHRVFPCDVRIQLVMDENLRVARCAQDSMDRSGRELVEFLFCDSKMGAAAGQKIRASGKI